MADETVGLRFVVNGRGAAVGAMGSVRSSLVSVRGAALATGAALFGVAHALSSSVDEAREAERVGKVTDARLKSTGHAANVTAKGIGKLATAISRKTGVDDEAIQSGENLLLTFTKIRNEQGKGNRIFTRATSTITDMAAAMAGTNEGLDLKSATIQVGKALNDPIKGVSALGKVGVSFTEQQKEQIKTLVESGKTLDAQKIILRELRTEFGGTAQAQATMGDKVSVAWGNIQEQLGTALLPMIDEVERAFLKKGVPAIEHYLDVFQRDGIPAIQNFVDHARPVAEELIPAIGSGLRTTVRALEKAAPYAKDMIEAFNNAPEWVKTGLALGAGGALLAKKLGLADMFKSVIPGVHIGTPVYVTNFSDANFGGRGPGAGGAGLLGSVLKWIKGPAAAIGYSAVGSYLSTRADGSSTVGPSGTMGAPTTDHGIGAFDNAARDLGLGPGGSGSSVFTTLLTEPSALAAARAGLDATNRSMRDLTRSTKGVQDQAAATQAELFGLSRVRVDVDTSPASNKLTALEQQAIHTISTLISAASGGLFGGSGGDTPSPRPRVPRAPRVVAPGAAGRVAADGSSGSTEKIVIPVYLDSKIIAESTVDRLKDAEARR